MTKKLPLMPKATAVWLVDNTALTFEQIANFCGMHPLEIKAIADGEGALNVKGQDPVNTGQLTREEIKKGEDDPKYKIQLVEPKYKIPERKTRKGPKYTPLARRQDRPNAILWLLRNYSFLKDAQIVRLLGTTKNTINQIRNREHWNYVNLVPQDPVILGLCSQFELEREIEKSRPQQPVSTTSQDEAETKNESITSEAENHENDENNSGDAYDNSFDVSQVFAKLKGDAGSN